jgi:NHL repeat
MGHKEIEGHLVGSAVALARSIPLTFLAAPLVLVAFFVLFLISTAAQAAPVTIATLGSGAGKVDNPSSVAVDQSTGDLYVADGNNLRIDKFDSDGNFLLAWGWGVADGKSHEPQVCGPAAEPPTKRCFHATSNGASPVTEPPGAVAPNSVAVEQSSGDVYVAERFRVSKFSPAGEFLWMADTGVGTLSLAFDPAGDIWVGATDRLREIEPDGTPGAVIVLPGAGYVKSLAIDSAGDFYVNVGDFYDESQALAGVRKLEAGTGALLETIDKAGLPEALALDSADNLYVGECARKVLNPYGCTVPYRFKIFSPSGEQVSQFGAGQVIGVPGKGNGVPSNALTVDEATGRLYVASSLPDKNSAVQAFSIPNPGPLPGDEHVEDLLPTTTTLAATLNPEGNATEYHFEYVTQQAYEEQGQSFEGPSTIKTPEKTLPGSEYDDEEVTVALEGLIPDTAYRFRLVATNHCKPAEPAVECTVAGEDTAFTTRPAIGIETQWATEIAAKSATLHAELDPLGVEATWWVEYGEGEAFEEETAKVPLAAGFGAVPVSVPIVGLDPGTAYSYRFVAEDERDGATYVVKGQPRGFTTQLGGLGFSLPDSRAWEMVSPAKKFGGRILSFADGHVQAAAGGDALAYLSLGSLEENPEGSRLIERSSVLARRGPGGEWSSRDLTAPHTSITSVGAGQGLEYKLLSTELGQSLMEPRDATPLSPQASKRTPYLRANAEPPAFTPLVTDKEGFANVPPGTEFGGDPTLASPLDRVTVLSATADLGHVALKSGLPLAAGAAKGSLYLWSEDSVPTESLEAVSVLPNGAVVAGDPGAGSEGKAGSVRHAISEDGTRVFWTAASTGGLYLRDRERDETARLDVVQPGGFGIGTVDPTFLGADREGTVAFFTDSHQLTEDSGEDGRDLYRCEVVVEGDELGCELTNLSGEAVQAGESSEVQGLALGVSDDASRIFFVARGVLDEEPNSEEENAIAGEPNLYAWQEGEGVRFVATLAEEDEQDWGVNPEIAPTVASFKQGATASPSGRYLAFMSELPLTGYDNRDAKSGEPAQEVFRYDAVSEELTCASCNPSGARPLALRPGFEFGELAEEFDPLQLWAGRKVAALLPEATKVSVTGVSLYRTRSVHDNGRVFFNAVDSLVPADSNGDGDVYQYEPLSTGSCSASAGGAGTALVEGGCVSLISSGVAEGTSAFLDASENGSDVFFYTSARLSVTDVDEVIDVYDARVDGIPARLTPIAECLGDACQPPAVAPDDPTPASAAFQGAGNVREAAAPRRRSCPKGRHKAKRGGKVKCKGKKTKGVKKAKRQGKHGGSN